VQVHPPVDELGAYTEEDAIRLPLIQIDVDGAAEEVVRIDGVGHFLNRYDGNEYETEGTYWYREN